MEKYRVGKNVVVFYSWFGCWSWVSCSFSGQVDTIKTSPNLQFTKSVWIISQIHSMQRPFSVGLSPRPGQNLTMLIIPFLDLRNHPQQLAQSSRWYRDLHICFYLTIHIFAIIYHQLIIRVTDCYATIRSMQFFICENISQQHFWRHVQVIINVLIIHVEPRPFPNPAPTAKWPNLYGITGGRKPRGDRATPGGQVPPTDWAKLFGSARGTSDFLQSWRIQGSNETGGCGFLHFCSRNRRIYIQMKFQQVRRKKHKPL